MKSCYEGDKSGLSRRRLLTGALASSLLIAIDPASASRVVEDEAVSVEEFYRVEGDAIEHWAQNCCPDLGEGTRIQIRSTRPDAVIAITGQSSTNPPEIEQGKELSVVDAQNHGVFG